MRLFLHKKDKGSTSNMKRHATKCFGSETVAKALQSDAEGVRKGLRGGPSGTIPAAFEARGSGVVSYSTRALSKVDVR